MGSVPLLLMSMAAIMATIARAETVILRNGQHLEGRIEYWDDRGVSFRTASGTLYTYPLDRVREVQADLDPRIEAAEVALSEHRPRDAIRLLDEVREQARLGWVRDRAAILLLQASREVPPDRRTAEVFLAMSSGRDDIGYMRFIPLRWQASPLSEDDRRFAQSLRERKDPLAQLIGHSWLLDSEDRAEAAAAQDWLRSKIAEFPQRIDWYVRCQFARARRNAWNEVEREDLAGLVRKIPAELRTGPMLVLADAYAAAGDHLSAALVLIEAALVLPPAGYWSHIAMEHAARETRLAGFPTDADRLDSLVRENNLRGTK